MRKNMKENRWKGCLVGRRRGGGEKIVRPNFFFFNKCTKTQSLKN